MPGILCLCYLAPSAQAETLTGRVTRVKDGDTFVFVAEGTSRKRDMRFAGIDSPEKRQVFGREATQHLAELVMDKDVSADCYKVDRNKRDVCSFHVDGADVGLAQI
jgi:micrococcal nuclease